MRPLLLATTFALLFAATGLPVGATGPAIQPGIEIVSGSSQCTLAWVFDDAGTDDVYATTAAHCVSGVGAVVSHGGGRIGAVAWQSPTLDFVLVQIDASRVADVRGDLLGHPTVPTGVATTADTPPGSVCRFSGYGTGYRYTDVTREQRVGPLTKNDGREHFCGFPVTPGDSGGPVALASGLALGVVNTVGASFACCDDTIPLHVGEGGVSLQGALTEAALAGYDLSLRTA